MGTLIDVMKYIIYNYPFKNDLSNARLTKIVYLSDWRHCIIDGDQITDIKWYFNNYGPFVWDIKDTAVDNPDIFSTRDDTTHFGSEKTLISAKSSIKMHQIHLSKSEKDAIDHIIDVTKDLYWEGFIRLVYSTYPVTVSERYSELNLKQLAIEYTKSKILK